MVRETRGLSQAFAEYHPAEAAQVLEALPPAESAAFLAELPIRASAAVVRRMAPPYSARCAEAFDEGILMALAEVLGPQPTAALLKHLPPERQARALERLPVAVAVAVRLLIGYPRDTAGAWMEPWPLALAPDVPVQDAVEQLRRFEGTLHDLVFVVEGDWRVSGVLSAATLLRAAPREPLSRVMRQPAPRVPALTPINSVRDHPGWHDFPALAVVERQDRLVGALHRQALAAALAEARPRAVSQATGETLAALGSAYWQSVSALAQLTVSLLPGVRRVGDKEGENER